MPTKHEVRCLKCRRVLLNEVERQQLRCYGCRDASPVPRTQGAGSELEALLGRGLDIARRWQRWETDGNKIHWELGDWAIQIIVGREVDRSALQDFAERIGMDYELVLDCARVARAFSQDKRRTELSFTHHRLLAARADKDDWLAAAAEQHWTIRVMQDKIKVADTAPAVSNGDEQIQTVSEATSQTRLNSETPAPVSVAQRVEDILERVPSDMMTPVSTPVAPEPHCVTCRCFEDTGSVQSSVAKVTV